MEISVSVHLEICRMIWNQNPVKISLNWKLGELPESKQDPCAELEKNVRVALPKRCPMPVIPISKGRWEVFRVPNEIVVGIVLPTY
jgi:hypothetical protein